MTAADLIDLDDTSGCGYGRVCEVCREPDPDIEVVAVDTAAGVACAPMCGTCTGFYLQPAWSRAETERRVAEHCAHLGVDVDVAFALAVLR